ncbi:NAD(P)/FAD-dependent oxidoreductase [Rhodovulum tesquicola]|uniref:FAD-dependent oxidoreductase n=1 Tax=Rhodovulum tesquicola TaxID=540254 RepID=UPI00209792E4|nr:FAD/NAD(P)-binding oxidoreductase [Rhodovulum tesquicola]MCO8144590.1 NAD(P)/FAD-dependent oxidoreductase [Rhodovulum tesquicola]
MQDLNRRRFFAGLLAGTALAGAAGINARANRTQAVIVGGGPAGAAAALALREAHPANPVLLVERDPRRLGPVEQASFDRPSAGPDLSTLRRAGVEVVLDDVMGLDWRAARLNLFSGRRLAFDSLLLAPGTAALAEPIPGLDAVARHLWPAAWGNAREARRLRAQLAALPEDGHVVLRLPAELSHPDAALGRAVQIATLLDRTRPDSRFTVLEAGMSSDLSQRFRRRLDAKGVRTRSEWRTGQTGGNVLRVDARNGMLETDGGLLRADVVNFVGLQGAGTIARAAGLSDASGWCPVDARGRSLIRPEAVILGDARKDAKRHVADAVLSGRRVAAFT